MKRIAMGLSLFTLIYSQSNLASSNNRHDIARVVSADPVYQTIEHRIPRETCWTETVKLPARGNDHRSATPAILGGIIGGAIGHELGHGKDNKKIGAVVGSILGMSVGNDIKRKHRQTIGQHERFEDIERCELSHTIETEQIIKGYNVNYRYHGQNYTTFMKEYPGDKIRVAVSVRPLRG